MVEARIRIGGNKFRQLVIQAVGTTAYQQGFIIDYERKVVQQLCEKQLVASK